MEPGLKRYWVKLEAGQHGFKLGVGVTARNKQDALDIMASRLFRPGQMPMVVSTIEDIDVSTLDERHVLPNIRPPIWRGIWFPAGFDDPWSS